MISQLNTRPTVAYVKLVETMLAKSKCSFATHPDLSRVTLTVRMPYMLTLKPYRLTMPRRIICIKKSQQNFSNPI